jgi:NAD(P)-dependent dehydrogenase (short-subunit alcohol dehydrogenase family)
MSNESLKGKVAVITGASRGIGEATAKLLAQNGCKVVVSSRDKPACDKVANEIKENGGEALGIAADIAKEEDIKKLFEETERIYGGLDFVFANAGKKTKLLISSKNQL